MHQQSLSSSSASSSRKNRSILIEPHRITLHRQTVVDNLSNDPDYDIIEVAVHQCPHVLYRELAQVFPHDLESSGNNKYQKPCTDAAQQKPHPIVNRDNLLVVTTFQKVHARM